MKSAPRVSCPRCQQMVLWVPEASFKPFCSERCKMIDLGKWANNEHAIPGPPAQLDPDTIETFE